MNMNIDTFEKRMNEGYYDVKNYVEEKYVIDEDKTVKENIITVQITLVQIIESKW